MSSNASASLPAPILKANLLSQRLPPDVNRILYVKSLPFKISPEELYDIFGKYGAIRQIRLGSTPTTRGKAYVVYEDINDAYQAVNHLNGFNVMGRYLVVLFHGKQKDGTMKGEKSESGSSNGNTNTTTTATTINTKHEELEKKRIHLEILKSKLGVKGMEED